MGESGRSGGISVWLVLATVVAVLATGAAVGALLWASGERDQAARHHARTARVLATQADTSSDRLASTRAAIAAVEPHVDAVVDGTKRVADLAHHDATLVQAALDAGTKGDVPAYNQAVSERNALAPQVDAAVEKLRTEANAVLETLASVTNRTVP